MRNLILFFAAVFIEIATAIAQTNHVFDGHLWVAYCLYVAAGVLILVALFSYFTEKRSIHTPPPPPSQHNEQRVEASPHQTVIIGGGLAQQPTQSQSIPTEVRPEIPDVKPRPSRIAALRDLYPQSGSDEMYLVVPFRNESNIAQDRRFTAHIAYKNGDQEIAEVETGTWFKFVGSPGSTTFPSKHTRELAVLRLKGDQLLTGAINWFHQRVSRLEIWEPEVDGNEITEPIKTIEITLRGWNLPLRVFVFDLGNDGKSLHWREEK